MTDKADAARIMLIAWIIEALGGRETVLGES
jgi:hypothetical protein